ncbi:MAG TPA: divergent polysaccharide deacetylase family protein [Candidatus Udaeobacter sp.]|nr:divergent polysaccharide deacetylase family protein [Candidatus Udaeobacter sp.]
MPRRFGGRNKKLARRGGRVALAALRARLGKLPRVALPLTVGGLVIGAALGAILAPSHAPKTHAVIAASAPVIPLPEAKPATSPAPKAGSAPPVTQTPAATPAWEQYALAVPETDGHPVIAIVIDDMGIDKPDSARVIGLPGPITIAFMSYATGLEPQAAAARAAGHEIWLHVPMEPMDGALDAGPDVLKTELSPDENRRRLDWALSRLTGYVGVNNHMGSKFTKSEADMALVMEVLKARGLAFLDSRTTKDTVAARVAGEYGVPHIDRNVFIDNDETVDAVLAKLVETEQFARQHGYALAIGHPHPTTIEALSEWLPSLRARGFVLVPASALLRLEAQGAG